MKVSATIWAIWSFEFPGNGLIQGVWRKDDKARMSIVGGGDSAGELLQARTADYSLAINRKPGVGMSTGTPRGAVHCQTRFHDPSQTVVYHREDIS